MKDLLKANSYNLTLLNDLLDNSLTTKDYINASIAPYYSSIGNHTRHILDFYSCILEYDTEIDLTKRNRDCPSNLSIKEALVRIVKLQTTLESFKNKKNTQVIVGDDLGLGVVKTTYYFGSLLAYANSHTTHHFASIAYLMHHLGIKHQNIRFGYNTTSPEIAIKS
jgi:hypothetical protein